MKRLTPLLLAISALIFSQAANAQPVEAKTVPVGVMTVTIAGSPNGTSYSQTPIAIPLREPVAISGSVAGKIAAVGSNTISITNASWTPSALAQLGAPFFVNITGGVNEGRTFQITANTADQLTVNSQGLDLGQLNFVVGAQGDTFEIVAGDTLLGILGNPTNDGIIGGTQTQFSANQTDRVLVNDPSNNGAFTYYFNTDFGQWRRLGNSNNQGNLVISPKSGLVFSRISTSPLELTFTGAVPATDSTHQVPTLGTTILSTYFPVDVTLAQLGLENSPTWRKNGASGITLTNCDRVLVKVGVNTFSYYFDFNLSQWRRAGSSNNQGPIVITAGSSVRVLRAGAAGQTDTWNFAIPYTLN